MAVGMIRRECKKKRTNTADVFCLNEAYLYIHVSLSLYDCIVSHARYVHFIGCTPAYICL